MNTYLPGYLKKKNRIKVMNLFLEHGEMTRPDISRMTGISMPTVIKIVDFLICKDVLIEKPGDITSSDSGFGRKSQILHLNAKAYSTIGLYFEGNGLGIGLVNMAFEIIEKRVFPLNAIKILPEQRGEFSDMLVQEVRKMIDTHPETNILGVGVALPGIVDCQNMRMCRSKNYAASDDFFEAFPAFRQWKDVPVYLENDVNAAALGEMIQRKLFNKANLLYLSLGTGFGSGIIIHGQIWHGASYYAGNVARVLVPQMESDELHYNDKKYMEDYISQDELQKKFGFDFRYRDSCSEEKSKEVIRYISRFLALVIHDLSHLFDICDFVIAGLTVEYFGQSFMEILEEEVKKLEDSDWPGPKINMFSSISGQEGIIGAAYVAFSKCFPNLLAGDE